MHFYKEVETYSFRQPYIKRYENFRWYFRPLDHINNPSILEYGCGAAILTEWLIARFPDFEYTVADIPSTTLEFVKWKKTKFDYHYLILTIGPGKDGIPLYKDHDLIICQDVLEHTPNPLEIVTAFVDHLSPGGVLIVDFVNAPGGENLEIAVQQREAVKNFLKSNLIPLKPIDEPKGNNGLYVKNIAEP
jgi:2-polyprenyl-3-methyl-5-hydroxy-6-metoxy-1,4-benzoquinol methylase